MQMNLETEFSKTRLTTFRDGRRGLLAGLACDVREPTIVTDAPLLDFIASDESVDRYNEVIELAGWQLDNYRKNPVVMDSHRYDSIADIVGRSEKIAITDGKLVNQVKFAVENPMGNLAYKLARGQFIKSESVGFIPIEWVRGNESQGEPYRTFKKQELIEISLVAVPANPGATIGLALKSGAIEKSDLTELLQFLKQFGSDQADPGANARPSGAGIHEGQLLRLARAAAEAVRRA